MSDVRLPLSRGLFAIVDAADGEKANRYKWRPCGHKKYPRELYAKTTIRRCGKKLTLVLHRYLVDAPSGVLVDHRDGDGLNNRRSNLRLTDRRGNARNITSSKNQKRGGYKGVVWRPHIEKWGAQIGAGELRANGKRKMLYLGSFADPTEAARAYDAAALKHFGEFASLNFPLESEAQIAASVNLTRSAAE